MAKESKNSAPSIPAEFERIDQPDIEGWWTPKKGSVLTGQIVGFQVIEERDIVLVRLSQPTSDATIGDEPCKLDEGQIIGVGMRHKLKVLMHYVDSKARIYIQAIDKQTLKGGRTMWDFTIGVKGRKVAPPIGSMAAQAIQRVGASDDNIPF